MSRLSQECNACDEINPLEDNDLVKVIHKYNNIMCKHIFKQVLFQYGYTPISPNYSPDNKISSIQEVIAKVIYKIFTLYTRYIILIINFVQSIDENDGYDSDNFAQYPPWFPNPNLYLRQRALVVDENDGPTSFSIQSPPPSPSFFDKPSTSKRGAQHLTQLHGVKRKVIK